MGRRALEHGVNAKAGGEHGWVGSMRRKFERFLVTVILEGLASGALGLFIGAVAPTTDVALAMFPPFLVLMIVFNGFNIAEESTAWYRGEQCVVSHGDSIAEDVCFDEPTQLEQSDDEFLWDGNHDFASHAEEETRCYDDEQDVNAEDYYHLFYGDEEETFCYDYQEDVNAEDCSYY